MALSEQLNQDFKTALKAKDEVRVATLRMLKTAIKNQEVQNRRPLEDQEILTVISSQIKQRRDSIVQFEQGGRTDLADREKMELAVLEAYLPAQMDREQIETAVADLIVETGASSVKDMGRVMKAFMGRFSGQADGKLVNDVVKQKLST